MLGDLHPERVRLREAREATIERLSAAFARDELGLEEFERRVDAAFACHQVVDFARLVSDLLEVPVATRALARVEVASQELVQVSTGTAPRVALAVLGNVERRGRWRLPRSSRALSVLGNVELDLRGVVLPPGVTELRVRAVLGNIEIIVPPELVVECEGVGMLGSFSSMSRVPPELGDEPVLRVTGSAVLGNVEIRTLPRPAEKLLPSGR